MGVLLNYLEGSAEVKEEEISSRAEEILNPQASDLSLLDPGENLDFPTIHAVVRFASTSKAPILIIKEKDKEFRCCKTKSKNDLMWFDCSKRHSTKCNFSMRVRMLITEDPEIDLFWEIENWEILKCFRGHTCHLVHKEKQETLRRAQSGSIMFAEIPDL